MCGSFRPAGAGRTWMVRSSCRPRSLSTLSGGGRRFGPAQGVEPVEQGGLVVEYGEDEVRVLVLPQPSWVSALGLHGVADGHLAGQVERGQQRDERAGLVALVRGLALGEYGTGAGERGEQMRCGGVGGSRAAAGLAVDGGLRQPGPVAVPRA